MDVDDFRVVLESCGVDVWTFIETAIAVARDRGAALRGDVFVFVCGGGAASMPELRRRG